MKSYRVSLILNERGLLKFLDRSEALNLTIEAVPEEQDEEPAVNEPEAIYKPRRVSQPQRRQRRSKVISTIISALQNGAAGPAVLKQALTDAGLSAGSLGTGIAILQREGAVRRDEGGEYLLAREAAE